MCIIYIGDGVNMRVGTACDVIEGSVHPCTHCPRYPIHTETRVSEIHQSAVHRVRGFQVKTV